MRVSVVTPARDEGREIWETIMAIGPRGVDEIIVVDDGSRDKSTEGLKNPKSGWPSIRVMKQAKPIGCCPCRNIGGRAATGDVLIFMDAHERISGESLRVLAEEAQKRRAVVQARSINTTPTDTLAGCGGQLQINNKAFIDTGWGNRSVNAEVEQRMGVLGACYAIPKDLFERIGGFMDHTGLWGSTEAVLTMKCLAAGIPMYVHRDIYARHKYQKASDRKFMIQNAEVWKSRLACARIVYTDETWRNVIDVPEKELNARGWPKHKLGWAIDHYKLRTWLEEPQLQKEHDAFQNIRVQPDEYLFRVGGCWRCKPGAHVALVRLYNFEEYQTYVLDKLGAVVDTIWCVSNPGTLPGVIQQALEHPKVSGVWYDEHKWDQAGSYERAFNQVKELGLQPATIYYADHDEIPPEPFVPERDQFMASDKGCMQFYYLFSWGDPDRIVRPDIPAHSGPLTKLVKWNSKLSWTPYRGCCKPNGSGEAWTCSRPMRHLTFMTQAWRDAYMATTRYQQYKKSMDWVAASDTSQVTVPYDDRTWERWIRPPDLERTTEHHLRNARGARGRNKTWADCMIAHWRTCGTSRPITELAWLDVGTRDGWMGEYLQAQYGIQEFLGIEYVAKTVEAAQALGRKVEHGDSRNLVNVADESRDIVTMLHTLEHVPDPETAAREAWRVLRPGGLLGAEVPIQGALGPGHMSWFPDFDSLRRLWPDGELISRGRKAHNVSGVKHAGLILRKPGGAA